MIEPNSAASVDRKIAMPHQPFGRARRTGPTGSASPSSPCQAASTAAPAPANTSALVQCPVSRNTKTSASAPASAIGHGESDGMSSTSSSSPSTTVEAGVWCPSASTRLLASRSSHIGYGLLIAGIIAKLYGGGGEGTAHSSVAPSNGSRPGGAPPRSGTARVTNTKDRH